MIVFDWNGIFEPNEDYEGYNFKHVYCDVLRSMSTRLANKCATEIWDTYFHAEDIHFRMTAQREGYKQNMFKLFAACGVPTTEEALGSFERWYLYLYQRVPVFQQNIRYVRKLAGKVRTALLSDTDILGAQCLYKSIPVDIFDYVHISCMQGAYKGQPEAYEWLRLRSGVESQNILFIDDREHNVQMARDCGWNAEQLANPTFQELRDVCEAFLAKE